MNSVAISNVDHEFVSIVQDLLDNTSSVIYVKDLGFRYLMINRQYETLFHVTRTEVLGKTDFDIFPADLAHKFRVNDLKVLETGQSLEFEEVAPHDDRVHHYVSIKFPLRDAFGSIYAMAGISTDVTERIRAQKEIATLRSRQDLILDSVGDGICSLDSSGRVIFLNPSAERMLQWKSDELRGRCHSQIVANSRPSNNSPYDSEFNPVAAVLNGKTTSQIEGAKFRRRDGSLINVEGVVAPIHESGEQVGAVVAFRDTSERKKQHQVQQEIQTARRIQNSLYPKSWPQIPKFEFAARAVSCTNACGDYYDFIPWGENQLGIAVGDVSGHGLGAALEMVETRAILRTTILTETDPVQCMTRLNQILSEDLPEDMFVTLFLARLNTIDRTLTYSSAGHEALLLKGTGEMCRLESTGTVLGLDQGAKFIDGKTYQFQKDDILLIATDGLAETISPNRELFGRNRIEELLKLHQAQPASQILSAILSTVEIFREDEPQRDDITAVVLKAT